MKSRLKNVTCMILLSVLLALAGSTAMATEETPAQNQDTSMEETGNIIVKKGKKYYKYSNGKFAKKKFVEVKNKTYYFDEKGVMVTGWTKISGEYYYFDRKNGVQKKDCKIDGITLNENGEASLNKQTKKKVKLMITARKQMMKITKPTDSKSQKLKKVFNWVLKHPYRRYRILRQAKSSKGWEMTFANDIFKKGRGCCVSEACAFAFLAKECGYEKVYICDDTGHAWTEINGRVYDTLFAETRGFDSYYNSTYAKAKLHRSNKKKI